MNELSTQEKIDEEVFINAYIPKRLDEVIDVERDIKKAKSGASEDLVYKKADRLWRRPESKTEARNS